MVKLAFDFGTSLSSILDLILPPDVCALSTSVGGLTGRVSTSPLAKQRLVERLGVSNARNVLLLRQR
jgi:hypothetical protein